MVYSPNVVSAIVNNDLCSGCGVCAGCCPRNNLSMAWRSDGDLVPTLSGKCPPSCNVCVRVCPFGESADNEAQLAQEVFGGTAGISVHQDIGYHLSSLVGYSCIHQHRLKGSSGGMATWMMEMLLLNGCVDEVICVGPTNDRQRLFAYQIVDNVNQLRQMAGSRYYPVDAAQAIRTLNSSDIEKRYAFIGLPCTLKGLRLAMKFMPRLKRRIAYMLGLVCGHLPNRYYTEYLSGLSQVPPDQIVSADYRRKIKNQCANNYHFRATAPANRFGKDVSWNEIKSIWGNNYFQVNSCNFCDDVFAELADAVFMDAWLPEYQRDPRGTSVIVVRRPDIHDLFLSGCKTGNCRLEEIAIARVARCQQGVIHKKRKLLGARLYCARSRGLTVPRKRFAPDVDGYRKHRRIIDASMKVQQTSKQVWPALKAKNRFRFPIRFSILSWPLYWQQWVDRFHRVIKDPSRLLQRVMKG